MIGQTVSHYKIVEKIGVGGLGVVYRAEDTKLLRSVALKFLPPEMTRDEDAKKRFIQEARAASVLDHPNIAVVHEIDETADGHAFICMTYYDGQTLKSKLAKAPLSIDEAVRIVIQISSGLQRAHESGIVHRDIKPGNIIVTSKGEVKIVDFGLAKLSAQSRATRTQFTGGTAAYMSPEQIMGSDADARSDLFSLGVVFYEAVTGRRPFAGEHESALFYSIVNAEPVPPSSINAEIPHELELIILQLLEKDPARRTQNARDLRDELKHYLGESPATRPISHFRAILHGRYSTPIVVGGFVLLATLILLASGLLQRWLGVRQLPDLTSIAVLPFRIIGGDSLKATQCDGLYEIIASKLVQFQSHHPNLSVIATSDSRTLRNGAEAYRKLAATVALNCSFQFSPGVVQITVDLEDTRTSRIIGSDIINDDPANLRGIESKIVRSIATIMSIEVTSADIRGFALGTTKDDRANDLYVEARGDLYKYTNSARLNSAISKFQRALSLDPQFALAQAGLGEAYWRKYEATKDRHWVDSAEGACSRALQLNDKLLPVHLVLGIVYRGTGRDTLAAAEFQSVLAADSLNADAIRELATTYLRGAKFSLAEETYRRAIALRPKDWKTYNSLGGLCYGRGRYEDAIAAWNKVVELAPDIRSGYTNLGAAYFALERWQEAIEKFKQSIAIDSTNYGAYNNMGNAYYYDGMYDRAIQAFEKARSIVPTDHHVWGGLGAAYHELGSTKLAQEAYDTAARLADEQRKVDPRDLVVVADLAGYDADLGRKSESLSLVRELLSRAPNDPEMLGRAGMIFELLHEREQALKNLETALKLGYASAELKYSPEMRGLRNDPRYTKLIEVTTKEKAKK